jgi:hypothetical protein
MGRLRRLLGLPPAERRLILLALPLVAFVRATLWLVPFRLLRRWQARWAVPKAGAATNEATIPQVVRAVTVASRVIPGATCLTQALAAQLLLARRGHTTTLRLGVGHGPQRRFAAHAWLEHEGRPIIGEFESGRYTPLPAFTGEGR